MNVEDSCFRMCLQMLNISRNLLHRLYLEYFIHLEFCAFLNDNIEIPQMVLLALVTILEFEWKALYTSVIN